MSGSSSITRFKPISNSLTSCTKVENIFYVIFVLSISWVKAVSDLFQIISNNYQYLIKVFNFLSEVVASVGWVSSVSSHPRSDNIMTWREIGLKRRERESP